MLIGICGASGSGKSTIAEELARAAVTSSILVINQDAYYYDHPNMPFEERCALNYDEPSIFDHDLLLHDIRELMVGHRVLRKQYDYTVHRRSPQENVYLEPCDIIIIEGIHVFYDKRLRDLMDLKLYLHVDPDICLLRRIQRDMLERGRALDSISTQYTSTVKPMFDQYIRGYEQHADLIVTGGGKNAKVTKILSSYITHDLYLRNNQKGGEALC